VNGFSGAYESPDRPARSRAELDDRDLMRAHLEGDPSAFTELVRRHRDRLWAVAMRTLGDREEASDALQDALISAFRNAASFRGESAVTTWLHRIVVNACLDRVRRRQARPADPLPEYEGAGPVEPDVIDARLTSVVVHAALARLPEDQRAALVLVDLHGCSVEEAARILEVPTGTVKSRCSRGRARLAVLLVDLRPARAQGPSDGPAEPPAEATGRGTEPSTLHARPTSDTDPARGP
jgi:RNA polymerase sigma-70 factor (ECF subfamily)